MSSKPRAHSRDPHVWPGGQGPSALPPPPPLPAPLASLVGREQAVETVLTLLGREDVRLVTLTGPGGVGKSRLGLAAATALAAHGAFADGVRLVRLAAITDPDLVIPSMAMSLGLASRSEQAALPALQAALREQEMVLFIDNFEQVLAAGADLADLLRACPRLKALVTSRARLKLRGEFVVPVLPLPVPDPGALDPEMIQRSPAVELFVQRGREIRPDLGQTPDDAVAVAEICRRLDGLPLALELAAARLDMLPPSALLERLQQRLPTLVGGARDLPDRLRTMRDAIGWSYDLLDADEQRLFRRLGVFQGGFTAGAVTAISETLDELAALDVLGRLIDSSLVRPFATPPPGDDAEPRYRMLETIREFSLEQLSGQGEEQDARARHAAFFLDLAERADPIIFNTGGHAWPDRLERDLDNLRAALAWYRDTADHERLLCLAGRLASFWYYHGHLTEGQRWLDAALQGPAEQTTARARAWGLTVRGLLANVSGDERQAAAFLTESFAWWARTDDPAGEAIANSLLGGVLVSEGRYDDAAMRFEQNLEQVQQVGSRAWLAHALFHLGVIAFARGEDGRARQHLLDAEALYAALGSRLGGVDALRYLGLLACAGSDAREAAASFRKELALLRERGSRAAIAVGLADVATLATLRGEWEAAARLLARSASLLQEEGAAFSLPSRHHYEAAEASVRAALTGATLERLAAAGRSLTVAEALAEAEAVLDSRPATTAGGSGASLPATPDSLFTEREWDVLRLLAAGRSNPEIAEALFIGRGTVRTHVSNILGKLGARTRTEASALARARGLL